MFDVKEEIIFKIFDESPRFRRDYIEMEMQKENEVFMLICKYYNLNIVTDVYVQNINIETFNSKKRVKLKKQELILIKKLKVFNCLKHHLLATSSEVTEIDRAFTKYFGEDYHEVVDHDLSYQIIFKVVEIYFREYDEQNKNY